MIQDEGDYNIQETGLKMDGDQQGKTEEMVEATVMGQENFIDSVSGVEVIRMEGQDEEENLDADGRDLYATTEINGEKDDEVQRVTKRLKHRKGDEHRQRNSNTDQGCVSSSQKEEQHPNYEYEATYNVVLKVFDEVFD